MLRKLKRCNGGYMYLLRNALRGNGNLVQLPNPSATLAKRGGGVSAVSLGGSRPGVGMARDEQRRVSTFTLHALVH